MIEKLYNLWLLWQGKAARCDFCKEIVSGFFGMPNGGYMCVTCADKEHKHKVNKNRLKLAQSKGEVRD